MNRRADSRAAWPSLAATLFALAAGCGSSAAGGGAGHGAGGAANARPGEDATDESGETGSGRSTAPCAVTSTTRGPVQGTRSRGACAYQGIPFAAPPKGHLRWTAPVAPEAWEKPRPSAVAPWCPQVGVSSDEDCLYLNVWTPEPRPKGAAPVMVFVHGGGFVSGSASDPLYDGNHLAAATGNLVVTLNYRLGALGFLSMAPLRVEQGAHGSAGNYGILDQIAALQWVHDNIATFGGDPARVTLFGESAGGTSMFIHLAAPQSRGLFSRMIIESAAMGPYAFPGTLPESTADALGSSFAITAGCQDSSLAVSCLRETPVDTLLSSAAPNDWLPVVDGYVIPTDPIQAITNGAFTKVPTLIGNNRNEGTLLLYDLHELPTDHASYVAFEDSQAPGHGADIVRQYPVTSYAGSYFEAASAALTDSMFVCPARRVARAIAASGTPTFRYDFTHAVMRPEKDLGAFHTSELLFVFGTEFCWFGPCTSLQPAEVPLSRSMMEYWGAMARTGDPNGGGRFAWPKYDLSAEPEIVLNVVPSTETELEKSQCDFWDSLAP